MIRIGGPAYPVSLFKRVPPPSRKKSKAQGDQPTVDSALSELKSKVEKRLEGSSLKDRKKINKIIGKLQRYGNERKIDKALALHEQLAKVILQEKGSETILGEYESFITELRIIEQYLTSETNKITEAIPRLEVLCDTPSLGLKFSEFKEKIARLEKKLNRLKNSPTLEGIAEVEEELRQLKAFGYDLVQKAEQDNKMKWEGQIQPLIREGINGIDALLQDIELYNKELKAAKNQLEGTRQQIAANQALVKEIKEKRETVVALLESPQPKEKHACWIRYFNPHGGLQTELSMLRGRTQQVPGALRPFLKID